VQDVKEPKSNPQKKVYRNCGRNSSWMPSARSLSRFQRVLKEKEKPQKKGGDSTRCMRIRKSERGEGRKGGSRGGHVW